jgi:cytochrome c peroxidase
MSRAELIAACRELCPHSEDWYAAVRALGAASQAGFPAPAPQPVRKGWRATLTGILRSHHFNEEERQAFTDRVDYEYGSEVLYKQITQAVSQREKAERDAKRAAKREVTA